MVSARMRAGCVSPSLVIVPCYFLTSEERCIIF